MPEKVAPAAISGGIALLVTNFHGVPAWLLIVIITAALFFGVLPSTGRGDSDQRREARRFALLNFGALWMLTLAIVLTRDLSLGASIMVALGVGLAGTKALEAMQRAALGIVNRIGGVETLSKADIEQMIGDTRNDAQSAISEIHNDMRKHGGSE